MPYFKMPDGETLHVRIIGQGEPVLVLSGLGMQSWQWLPYLTAHLKQFKFIIPDWRGFGGSKNCAIPNDLNAIENHWRDIQALIQHLSLDQFILMGYSMGATTSMHGMQYGKLSHQIKAYLHIDQTPKISTDETWSYGLLGTQHAQVKQLLGELAQFLNQHPHLKWVNELNITDRKVLIELWLSFIELQASHKIMPKVLRMAFKMPYLQRQLLPIQRLDYLKWYIENYLYHNEDYRKTLVALDRPATFFIGEQSTLYPSKGQIEIANSVKNSKQVIFKKSGHTPLISEPIKFSREISNFLKSIT